MDINIRFEDSTFIVVFEKENTKLIVDEFWRSDGFGLKIFGSEDTESVIIATMMTRYIYVNYDVKSIAVNSNISSDAKAAAINRLLYRKFKRELINGL